MTAQASSDEAPAPLPAPSAAPSPDLSPGVAAASMALVGAVWLAGVARFWFTVDDAWITFRYAKNLASGVGLRFNPADPPVEGYSNPLLMLAAAACEVLGVDPGVAIPALTIACGLALLVAVYATVTGPLGRSRALGVAAAAVFASSPPTFVWATGGLETMAFALAVFVLVERLALRAKPEMVGASAAALAILGLRPEGPAWVAVIAVVALAMPRGRREPYPWLAFLAVTGVGLAALLASRWVVFGDLLPNTVYAKSVAGAAYWWRGFSYVATWALTYVTPLLLPLTSLVALRRPEARPVVVMAWAFPALAVVVGGDFLPMARFLVPSIAFHALLLALAVDELRLAPSGRWAIVGAVVAIGLLPAVHVHLVPEAVRAAVHYRRDDREFETEIERWRMQRDVPLRQRELGLALKAWCEAEGLERASVVAGAIGALGYHSGLHVFDQNGLVDPEIARSAPDPSADMEPGHDRKVSPTYFLPLEPTVLFVRMVRSDDGRDAARQLRKWADRVGRNLPREDYAPAVGATDDPRQHLFLVRRTADVAAATAKFEAEVAALPR